MLQEIVDRPGWSTGNALALIVTGTGSRVAESYDGGAARPPSSTSNGARDPRVRHLAIGIRQEVAGVAWA